MNRPLRVLLLHDVSGLGGGAELVVQDLAESLVRRGSEARVMVSTAGAVDEARADHVFRGTLGPFRALPEVVNPSAVSTLRRVLNEFDPDVVHLGMFLTQLSPAVLPLLRDRPTVWWANEYRAICPKGTRMLPDGTRCEADPGRVCVRAGCMSPRGMAPRWAQLRLLDRWRGAIDLLLTPSRAMADEFEARGWAVDGVLPHGAPEPDVLRAPSAEPRVAYAGRLVRTKGVDVLLRAFAAAEPAEVGARLAILGRGPEETALRTLAAELGIANRVDFVGHVSRDEVQRRLAGAWVQCVPSIWPEPYGLVTVEAQRRGTPVIASRVGAQPELVRDGETGFLVDPGDWRGLADRLHDIWSGRVDWRAVGDRGRRWADRHHDRERCYAALIARYHALITPEDT